MTSSSSDLWRTTGVEGLCVKSWGRHARLTERDGRGWSAVFFSRVGSRSGQLEKASKTSVESDPK